MTKSVKFTHQSSVKLQLTVKDFITVKWPWIPDSIFQEHYQDSAMTKRRPEPGPRLSMLSLKT